MHMNKISSLIGLKEKDVVSVVGSGGKTTFIYNLAEEIRDKKVMVTTSTKMFIPRDKKYLNIVYLDKDHKFNKGINFLIEEVLKSNKCHTSKETIEKSINFFDYSIIESDGSKRKPLKGWNEDEPVIASNTTKTIGIIPINLIGTIISDNIIHRLDRFLKISNAKEGEAVTLDIIANVIANKDGLFKNSKGEKILFLNKIENDTHIEMARKLLHILENKNIKINKIIGGSLKNKEYILFKDCGLRGC